MLILRQVRIGWVLSGNNFGKNIFLSLPFFMMLYLSPYFGEDVVIFVRYRIETYGTGTSNILGWSLRYVAI